MADRGANAKIGWVVDAQRDFMRPDGRLYVKSQDPSDAGAASVTEGLAEAVAWIRTHCDLSVFTADWHAMEDREIDAEAPDFQRTFPPHCMGRSEDPELRRGAEIIDEVRPEHPLVLASNASEEDAREIARRALEENAPVLIQKVEFSVFEGNPATAAFLAEATRRLGGDVEAFVCGVARDVCVAQAVEGLAPRGVVPVVLRDAVWGLGLEEASTSYARWRELGRVIDVADLEAKA